MQNELVDISAGEMASSGVGAGSEAAQSEANRRRSSVPWLGIALSGVLVAGLVLMSSWLFRG